MLFFFLLHTYTEKDFNFRETWVNRQTSGVGPAGSSPNPAWVVRQSAPQALPRPGGGPGSPKPRPELPNAWSAVPPAARQAYPPPIAPRAPLPACARTSHAAGSAPGPAEVTMARPRFPWLLFPGARHEVTEAPPRGLGIPEGPPRCG